MINTNKLKGLIKEKGLTQQDVANAIDKKPCTFNQKINNKRTMDLDEAEKIADLLGIDAGDFGVYFFSRPVA